MRQSSSPSASTIVKTAALLMAVPALLVPIKAAAQQFAASTPDFSRCDQMSQANPKGAISCRVEVLKANTAVVRQEGAAADVRGAAAEAKSACAKEVGDLRSKHIVATDILKELVRASGRPAAENDICQLRDGLRSGLSKRGIVASLTLR